jgi:ribonucleoside-diphosphate reductase alpha chain
MADGTAVLSISDNATLDTLLIDALNQRDIEKARAIRLQQIRNAVGGKNSWDSLEYITSRAVQSAIVTDPSRDHRLTYFALDTLADRYMLKDKSGVLCETPATFFTRVATGVAMGALEVADVKLGSSKYRKVLAHAQELYDIMSLQHGMFATPVLTNAGTSRGEQISCFLNAAQDSIDGVYWELLPENATLAQGGGGIGSYVGGLREKDARVKGGGKASGPIPFIKSFDTQTIAVNQAGANRRGSGAVYAPVNHPNIDAFLPIRRPKGAVEEQCLNIHQGVVVDDAFMTAVENRSTYDLVSPHTNKVVKTVDAYALFRDIIVTRVETGEPYILFSDTANRMQPETNKKLGYKILTSNLCIEIMLIVFAMAGVFRQRLWDYLLGKPTPSGRTAVCCLGSVNYATYSEWGHNEERLIMAMTRGLDNVLENFIKSAGKQRGYERAVHSAQRGRDIGLGVMGWFDYLQSREIPFESIEARSHNRMLFKSFGIAAEKASMKLAEERGPAPDALLASPLLARLLVPVLFLFGLTKTAWGLGLAKKLMGSLFTRNVNKTAIAPTASIGIIAGASPSIEPPNANSFLQKTLSGRFLVANRNLKACLQKHYPEKDTAETWTSIHKSEGSVQHLDWMSDDHKKVYRTASELNQREIVQQAADRQPHITQGQSLNLFFDPNPITKMHSARYLYDVHMLAWKAGVKSLYYVRTRSGAKVTDVSAVAGASLDASNYTRIANEECSVCQ